MSIRPSTVAIKVHDNDSIAEKFWWLTVYSKKKPPWDPTLNATPLDEAAKEKIWKRYKEIVARAAELRTTNAVLGTRDWGAQLPQP